MRVNGVLSADRPETVNIVLLLLQEISELGESAVDLETPMCVEASAQGFALLVTLVDQVSICVEIFDTPNAIIIVSNDFTHL